MDPDQAYDKYDQLLKERSDRAEEFVANIVESLNILDSVVGDVDVNQFLSRNSLNTDLSIKQTPDLLLLDFNNKLYVGDVAVSQSAEFVETVKTNKYENLRIRITEANPVINVLILNAVFDELGTNINTILSCWRREFPNLICTNNNRETFKRRLHNLSLAKKDIFNQCSDKDALLGLIAKNKNGAEKPDYKSFMDIGKNLLYKKYKPKYTELELYNMIINEVDNNPNPFVDMYKVKDPHNYIKSIKEELNEMQLTNYQHKVNKDNNYTMKTSTPFIFNPYVANTVEDPGLSLIISMREDLALTNDPILSFFPNNDRIKIMLDIAKEKKIIKREKNINIQKGMYEEMYIKYRSHSEWFCPMDELSMTTSNLSKTIIDLTTRYNEPSAPTTIHPSLHNTAIRETQELIEFLRTSTPHKSTNLTFDKPKSYERFRREKELIDYIEPKFELISTNVGVFYTTCIRKFCNDIAYLNSKTTRKGIYYSSCPLSGGVIMALCDSNLCKKNPYISFVSVSRFNVKNNQELYAYNVLSKYFKTNILRTGTTKDYAYLLTKIHKIDLATFSRISNLDYELRIQAMAMYTLLPPCIETDNYMKDYLAMTYLLSTDLHQNISVLMDLMKYLVSIPYSKFSSINELLLDKLDIPYKTNLDIYIRNRILDFVAENWILRPNVEIKKIRKVGYKLVSNSLNIKGKFSSFCKPGYYFSEFRAYTTECQLINQVRPKKLYSDQEMDKSCIVVCKYNELFEQELLKNDWPLGHDDCPFNFNSNFNISACAIIHALNLENSKYYTHYDKYRMKIIKKIREPALSNLSMRGACKELEEIMADIDYAKNSGMPYEESQSIEQNMEIFMTKRNIKRIDYYKHKGMLEGFRTRDLIAKSKTALLAGLDLLEDDIRNNETKNTTVWGVVEKYESYPMTYNLSPKEQRGGPRPIGSGSASTKQKLYAVESVFKTICSDHEGNLLMPNKNKNGILASSNLHMLEIKEMNNYKYMMHIVMDQSKFSESDNTKKFEIVLSNHLAIPERIRGQLIQIMQQNNQRVEFFPRRPGLVNKQYEKYVGPTGSSVIGKAGWVQGMLNHAGTFVHEICVEWLVYLFNKYYFIDKNKSKIEKRIECVNLVNSDDSYAVILADSESTIEDFYQFFVKGKVMFSLIQNIKKSYISEIIGEVIQKYIVNGDVVNVWSKSALGAFNGVSGIDLIKDIQASVGLLQTLIREGAPETFLCYLRNELRHYIDNRYQLAKSKRNDISRINIDRYNLPIEIGGWPGYLSTFELANAGSSSQLVYSSKVIEGEEDEETLAIIIGAFYSNIRKKMQQSKDTPNTIKLCKTLHISVDTIENIHDAIMLKDSGTSYYEIKSREILVDDPAPYATEDTFTRSILNPFSFNLPISKKVSNTVEKLNSFNYEPSGLGGLYIVQDSVQTLVADIKSTASTYILSLSESGFFQDYRSKAMSNAAISTKENITIGATGNRHTLIGAYVKLLEAGNIVLKDKRTKRVMLSKIKTLLVDTTDKSEICHTILKEANVERAIDAYYVVANIVPPTEDFYRLSNDLQSVLVDFIRPGYLRSVGYNFRFPERLEADKNTLSSIYPGWLLMDEPNDIMSVRAIYYHYLNRKTKRWHLGPSVDTSNMKDFLMGVYRTTVDGHNIRAVSYHHNLNDPSYDKKKHDYTFSRIMGILEYVAVLVTRNKIPLDVVIEETYIDVDHTISLREFFNSVEVKELFNHYDGHKYKLLSTLYFLATNDYSYLTGIMKNIDYSIEWIVPQKKKMVNGKSMYIHSYFEVEVSKGMWTLLIKGEPGKISTIVTNANSSTILSDLLSYLVSTVEFPGFKRVGYTINSWGSSNVLVQDPKVLKMSYENENYNFLVYDKDITYKTDSPIRATHILGNKRKQLAFLYNKTLKPRLHLIKDFEKFEIRQDDLTLWGVMSINKLEIKKKILNLKISVYKSVMHNLYSDTIEVMGLTIDELTRYNVLKQCIRGEPLSISDQLLLTILSNRFDFKQILCILVNRMIDLETNTTDIGLLDEQEIEVNITEDHIIDSIARVEDNFKDDEIDEEELNEMFMLSSPYMNKKTYDMKIINVVELAKFIAAIKSSNMYNEYLDLRRESYKDYETSLNELKTKYTNIMDGDYLDNLEGVESDYSNSIMLQRDLITTAYYLEPLDLNYVFGEIDSYYASLAKDHLIELRSMLWSITFSGIFINPSTIDYIIRLSTSFPEDSQDVRKYSAILNNLMNCCK